MRQSLNDLTKCFSIVEARIVEATIFDYEGCKACHKKLEGAICSQCKVEAEKETFWVCQLQMQEGGQSCLWYVFNSNLQQMLQHAKKGSILKGKIRSTVRLDQSGDNNL